MLYRQLLHNVVITGFLKRTWMAYLDSGTLAREAIREVFVHSLRTRGGILRVVPHSVLMKFRRAGRVGIRHSVSSVFGKAADLHEASFPHILQPKPS